MDFGTQPIKPADLMGQLEDWIRGLSIVPADCVFLSVVPDEFHMRMPPADSFIPIFPSRFPVWQSVVSGGGRENTGFDAVIEIAMFTRLSTDQELRSSNLIRNTAMGIVQNITKLIDRVQFWLAPSAADANKSPLREPMRIANPGFVLTPREYKGSLWSIAKSSWECKFSADLTSS